MLHMNRQWKKCELFEGEKKLIEKNNEGKKIISHIHMRRYSMLIAGIKA